MYLPPQFKVKSADIAQFIVRSHPFASLISVDDAGCPFVTHIPLHLVVDGDDWSLLGHVAKPNPHWRYLRDRPQVVATFMGPQAYMSPQVYPDLARVPTWSYLAVHCTGQASLIEDPRDKDRLLKCLIGDHEPAYAKQWQDLGEEYQLKMLAGIVGFEIKVSNIEAKIKINQHRPESHAAMFSAYSQGNENERALAQWMQRTGLVEDAQK